MIEFTGNYEDLSTDKGFQFKFYCERCSNGYMSPYQTNAVGVFEEVLRGASSLFGGMFGQAADSAYHVNQAVGGARHDEALRAAVAAIKPSFVQCKRCGEWTCREVCWNSTANLCKQCAPNAAEEESSARAQFVRNQVQHDLELEEEQRLKAKAGELSKACAHCGNDTLGKKFCPECGKPTAVAPQNCGACGAKSVPGSKFCGECGGKL
jgi:hypothetical protein